MVIVPHETIVELRALVNVLEIAVEHRKALLTLKELQATARRASIYLIKGGK